MKTLRSLVFVGRAGGASTSERGDILINTIVGLTLTAIVLFVAVPFLIHSIAAGNTAAAEQVEHDIGTAATQYYQDNQAYPTGIAALVPAYMAQSPTDPAGESGANFTLTATKSGNNPTYVVFGTVAHDPSTLAGLTKYGGVGTPGATCGASGCTKLVYDPLIGIEGT
jgi:type II secretory pathway pseudopilin PulG